MKNHEVKNSFVTVRKEELKRASLRAPRPVSSLQRVSPYTPLHNVLQGVAVTSNSKRVSGQTQGRLFTKGSTVEKPVKHKKTTSAPHLCAISSKSVDASGRHFCQFQVAAVVLVREPATRAIRCINLQLEGNNRSCLYEEQEETSSRNRDTFSTKAVLTGHWATTDVSVGDIINVIWSPPLELLREAADNYLDHIKAMERIQITDQEHFIVVNPTWYVSPSRILDAITCLRRSVILQLFSTFSSNRFSCLGNIRHKAAEILFLQPMPYSPESIETILNRILDDEPMLLEMLAADVSEAEVASAVADIVRVMCSWRAAYGFPKFKAVSFTGGSQSKMTFKRILCTEDKIYSKIWGIKGQIDVTSLNEVIYDKKLYQNRVFPVEIKSGRQLRKEHYAQVILYGLLTLDRYVDYQKASDQCKAFRDDAGVLFHVNKTFDMVGIITNRNELQSLILLRNSLATALKDAAIPPLSGNVIGECNRCFQRELCTRLSVSQADETIALSYQDAPVKAAVAASLSDKAYAHLSQHHLDYFQRMIRGLNVEELFLTARSSQRSWTNCKLLSIERARTGDSESFLYRFDVPVATLFDDVVDLTPSVGTLPEVNKYLAVDLVGKHERLLEGKVTQRYVDKGETAERIVELRSRRDLRLHLAWEDLSDLLLASSACWKLKEPDRPIANFGLMRSNVDLLMENEERAQGLRDIVVEEHEPCLSDEINVHDVFNQLPKHIIASFNQLNQEQKNALFSVLRTKNYFCIQGLPGTGKTTMLAVLVQILHALNKSVFICAYTHSAVDHLLLKLKDAGLDSAVYRIGYTGAVASSVRSNLVRMDTGERKLGSRKAFTDLLDRLRKMPDIVVGSTCYGVTHALLQKRRFDYCIVDEAGQINDALLLGPLHIADKFVLVGDHFQLPPLITSPEAKEIETSLLRRLFVKSAAHLQSSSSASRVVLKKQFRMNAWLMELNNHIFSRYFPDKKYLELGSQAIAEQVLRLPYYKATRYTGGIQEVLGRIIDPHQSVVFVDTQARLQTGEENQAQTVLDVLYMATRELVKNGMLGSDIGIICPYNKQVKRVENAFLSKEEERSAQAPLSDAMVTDNASKNAVSSKHTVKISTVDRFQGQEKACIFLFLDTLPKSSFGNPAQSLLGDWRRFSRARFKVVVFGKQNELSCFPVLESFLEYSKERECRIEVDRKS